MTTTSFVDQVKEAHAQGKLLVHMFETALGEDRENMLAVLSGKPGTYYQNHWRDVSATPEGYCGLATTAIKAGYPVPVWNAYSDLGLVFDLRDEAHVKPVHVASHDSYSMVSDGKLKVNFTESALFKPVADAQGLESDGLAQKKVIVDFHSGGQLLPAIIRQARMAVDALWEVAAGAGWEKVTASAHSGKPGMNEINVIAHLAGVKGIIVSEKDLSDQTPMCAQRFSRQVRLALELRDNIQRKYGHIITEPLPIFAYDQRREKDQLVALSPAQLAQPEQYLLSRQGSAVATLAIEREGRGWAR